MRKIGVSAKHQQDICTFFIAKSKAYVKKDEKRPKNPAKMTC
jgi:hypothetical protein